MKSQPDSTSIPNPHDDDFSYYYSFFQDNTNTASLLLDDDTTTTTTAAVYPYPLVMPNKRKKNTTTATAEDVKSSSKSKSKNNKKRSIAKLLTSITAIESEADSDRVNSTDSARREVALLESNHEQKSEAMMEYYSKIQDHYDRLDDADTLRSKRARVAATAAASTAAIEGSAGITGGASGAHHQRRLWVKDRSTAWWDQCNSADFPEAEFRRSFRMGRETFDMICDALGAAVAKEDTMLRAAIPVRQRVAVCIWRLATGEPLRLLSKRFGLGISTCHKLVLEVCAAIKSVLMPRFLQWPDESTAAFVKSRFESVSGIPNVLGAMYTTHIPIIAPKISVASYFNRRHTERNQKTSYSITLQGVIGPDGAFTDVCIGWPGSMPDDQVLEKSALHQRAAAGMLNDTWIVGGSSYPLMDWVLVPYSHQNLTWTQHAFNEKVGELRRVAVDAFARLKGRWACLQKRTEVKLQDLPVVLGACCVLHNICEIRREEMDPELSFELVDDDTVPDTPVRSETARLARDNISHNLLHRGLAGTAFFG